MNLKLFSLTLMCIFAIISTTLADDTKAATTAAPTAKDNTTAPAPTQATTPEPKINVLDSALCKKCICDKEVFQLDCSNKQMPNWFTDDEWKILQKGDLIFKTIKLEHNNLTTVPAIRAYPVENLYLGFNQIASITLGAFQNLTKLAVLDLSHNKLTSKVMVPDVFKGQYSVSDYLPLGKMRELDLGYNGLHNLDADLFEHLPTLEILILCGNTFQVIDHLTETAVAGLTYLKTLDLSYMELSDLPDNFLHGPRDLETLILTGNLFQELPDNIELSINLKTLVIDENPMKDFTGENIFPALISLKYLGVSYMPDLTTFGRGAFANLQNLTTLVASNNAKLSTIDVMAFALNSSNPEIFDYPIIEELHLHNNNLTVLDHDLLVAWHKIKVIDLRFNPWICDCTNHYLIHTLITQINNTTPLVAQNVLCNTPQAWKNKSILSLNADKKALVCLNGNHPETENLIMISLLVGILIGIPITIAGLVLYKRGCFGLLNRGNNGGSRAMYDRASFTDDFHI